MNQLLRLTECCICLMPYTDPRILPCLHSACCKCLENLQASNQKEPADVLPCPVCRKEFTIPPDGILGLQKNFFIQNLIDTMPTLNFERKPMLCNTCEAIETGKVAREATKTCVECQDNFCNRCWNIHVINKFTQHHRFVEMSSEMRVEEINAVMPLRSCSRHPHNVLSFYCGDCRIVVCVSCFVEEHKLHDCKDIKTVDADFRKQLEEQLTKMTFCTAQIDAYKKKMEDNKTKFVENVSAIENTIQLKSQHLKSLIDDQTRIVLDELSVLKQKHNKIMETEMDEIERRKTILQSFESYCSGIKSKGSPCDVCGSFDKLITRAVELEKENKEYLEIPYCLPDIKFTATDLDATFIQNIGNIIGRLEGSEIEPESYGIVIGGYDGHEVLSDVTKVNLQLMDDVSDLHQVPTEMQIETAAAVYRDSIYVTGLGSDDNEIWSFNVVTSTWKKCASFVHGRRRHSVAFVDKILYICGGFLDSTESTTDEVLAYDAIEDCCLVAGKLAHRVQNSAICVPFDSLLYILGGKDEKNNPVSYVQLYNTNSNSCSLLSIPMPGTSGFMRAALFEKMIILLGSCDCFLYNLDSGNWQVRDRFKTGFGYFGMTIVNGQLFLIGGGNSKSNANGETIWLPKDDIMCMSVINVLEDKPTEWKHHAKLPKSSLVFAFAKIELPR